MIKLTDTCYVTDDEMEAIVCCENGQWIRLNKEGKILELLSKEEVNEILKKLNYDGCGVLN